MVVEHERSAPVREAMAETEKIAKMPWAATDPPDRAWMIVTGWGVNDHSHLSKLILQHFN